MADTPLDFSGVGVPDKPLDFSNVGKPAEKAQIASEQDTRSLADKIVSAGLKAGTATLGGEAAMARALPATTGFSGALRAGAQMSMTQPVKTFVGGSALGATDEAVNEALKTFVPEMGEKTRQGVSLATTASLAGSMPLIYHGVRSLTAQLGQTNRLAREASRISEGLKPDVLVASQKMLDKLAKGDVSQVSAPVLKKMLEPFGERAKEIKATIDAKDNAIKELKVKYSQLTQDEKSRLEGLIQDRKSYIEGLGKELPGTKAAFNYGRDRFLPDNPHVIGGQAREKIVADYEEALDKRAKAASSDYKEMIDDAEAKEKRGMTVLMTDSHKQMVSYIDNLLTKVNLPKDFNNPLMTLKTALTKGAEMHLNEADRRLIALRKNVPLDQVPEKMFLQPTMEGMEIIRRKLNDVAFPAIGQPEGFNAIGAKNAEKIGEMLDKSMSEFSGYGTNNPYLKYKENYKKNSEYINKVKTSFGEQFKEKEDAFWKAPAGELIKNAASSPERYDHFVGLVGKENADRMISAYFVHEFETEMQNGTKSAFEFMKKNQTVLSKVSADKDIQNVILKMRNAEDEIGGFKAEIKKLQGAHPVETEAMKATRMQREALEKEQIGHAAEAKDIDTFLDKSGNDPQRLAYAVKASKDPVWRERLGQFINTPEQKENFVKAIGITLKDTPPNQVVEVFKRDILPTIRQIGIEGEAGGVGMSAINDTMKTIERIQNRSMKEAALVNFSRRLLGAIGSQTPTGTFVDRPVSTVTNILGKLFSPTQLPSPLK